MNTEQSTCSIVERMPLRFARRNTAAGQAVLALIFALGGLILFIALTLASLVTSFSNSSYGFRIAERAEMVASSGAADAMLHLLRNKDFESTNGYTMSVGNDTATVTVLQDTPEAGEVTITSEATVSLYVHTVTVIVSRNADNGLITVVRRTHV